MARNAAVVAVLLFAFVGAEASPDVAGAQSFLLDSQRADGAFARATDIAVPVQSTAETLSALPDGDTNFAALNFLATAATGPAVPTEYLARAAAAAGGLHPDLLLDLQARQHASGGFGSAPASPPNSLDTAYALQVSQLPEASAGLAAQWLVTHQLPDGAWPGPDGTASVFVTAQALHALWAYRHSLVPPGPLDSARAYLVAAQGPDGLWPETHETALAVAVLAPTMADPTPLAAAAAKLAQSQQANGSWADDIYITALGLRALRALESGYADRSRVIGRILDGEADVGVSGAAVSLSGAHPAAVASAPDGTFVLAVDIAGGYQLTIEATGYPALEAQLFVGAGTTVDLGTIRLLASTDAITGVIQGTVRDAASGAPLAGATIAVEGGPSTSTSTDGAYLLAGVAPGAFSATASKPGYESAVVAGTLATGGTILFSPQLRPGFSTTFRMSGVVTDAATGLPVSGAVVAAVEQADAMAVTGPGGAYELTGLLPGVVTVVVDHTDYHAASRTFDASANQQVVYSPALRPASGPGVLDIFGTVSDQYTGGPLGGVVVTLENSSGTTVVTTNTNGEFSAAIEASDSVAVLFELAGYFPRALTLETAGIADFELVVTLQPDLPAPPASLIGRLVDAEHGGPIAGASAAATFADGSAEATTDAEGKFELSPVSPGIVTLQFAADGYHASSVQIEISGSGDIHLGDWPLVADVPPEPVTVFGVVVSSQTNDPISGAQISSAGLPTLQTEPDGSFSFDAMPGAFVELDVFAAGFVSANYSILIDEENPDLGQIRLRPEGLDNVLPDLIAQAVTRPQPASDPDSFLVSGTLDISVVLHGQALDVPVVKVLAFYDANGNGSFDSAVDTKLGEISISGDEFGVEPVTRSIPVDGPLPFRDAPISVLVDSDGVVVERDDTNNLRSTALLCRRVPDPLAELRIRTKWHWQGSEERPTMLSVLGPAVVGQLTDDNDDGVIDHSDIPDVVVLAYTGSTAGALTAISGDDGRTLWQVERNLTPHGSAALADLTGDGVVEIIVPNYTRSRLVAFRHDGSLLWDVPTGMSMTGSNSTRDAVAIADLTGDGVPEIIHANRAFRADGTQLWIGNGDRGGRADYGFLPIVADITMDGRPNVLAGRTLYDNNGQRIWHRTNLHSDGFNAVGDFTGDGKPEIVLVSQGSNPGRIYLLSNTGAIIWGPVLIPGGGQGGAPTIGDFDGNGIPDIGIAGATRYVVFNADGSIKWQTPIQDASSHKTGSSLFDFEGDGKMEVVFADEISLYIFDGTTGAVRAQIPNGSGTTLEYPIIVDIDNSGSANIVLGSTSTASRGVRALEADGPGWMPTRSIWNQHSYHITNINDDGTVPAVEPHSWHAHNTYRAAALLDRDPLDAADLTIGRLRVIDNGTGQPLSLRTRVGNAGIIPSVDDILVSFFDGADADAPLLGTVTLSPLAPGAWRDIELTGVTGMSGVHGVTAVIDVAGRGFDCAPGNNEVWQPGLPTVGAVAVHTDALQYAPEQPVTITAIVHNIGNFTRDYTVQMSIEDAADNPVEGLSQHAVTGLAAGEQASEFDAWNTGLRLAGQYRVLATLVDGAGEPLAVATAGFAIVHDPAAGPLAELRLTTDRPRYHTSDQVLFNLLAQNQSASTLLEASTVHLTVTGPGGLVVYEESLSLHTMPPGAAASLPAAQMLEAAPVGDYHATAVWRDDHDTMLATAGAGYEVFEDLSRALRGTVTVSAAQLFRGQPQLCTETATNTGTSPATVTLRHVLARLDVDDPEPNEVVQYDVMLVQGASDTQVRSVATGGLVEGDYGCLLQAEIEDEWHTLAHAAFRLLPPPIQVDAALHAGDRGRLLLLLDPACADLDPSQAQGNDCDADPFGPADAPPLPVQREHLEAVLENAGWQVTVVTDALAFQTAFASRAYEVYALFNETVNLPEALQRAVVDDIEAGRGLLVAGNHDRRNGRIEEALGIHSLGKNLDVSALVLEPFGQHPGGDLAFFVAESPNALRLEGAETLGQYRTQPQGNQAPSLEPALTRHAHGRGTGIYAGFDLPVQSAMEGDDGEFAGLTVAALTEAHPHPYAPVAGRVFPLALALGNAGIAVAGEVRVALPDGVTLVEGPTGTVVEGGIARWPYALAEDEQLLHGFWLRLPEDSGWLVIEAAVFVPDGDELVEHERAQIVLNVQPQE